ncbi:MAG: GAF domain-containing protein [Rhizobiales bacterium]|nr:GAF domain-containing protein [Hyphomicrobiales bacterium]
MNEDQQEPSACDLEPIHLIGTIQPHGALIIADDQSRMITHVSANTEIAIGWKPDDLLGSPLCALLDKRQLDGLDAHAPALPSPELLKPFPCRVMRQAGGEAVISCRAHRAFDRLCLEFFPDQLVELDDQDLMPLRQRMIDDLRRPDTLDGCCAAAVRLVRLVTGYDRVLCYRLHADLHGEVVAEQTDCADSYLGLHYPASDIPAPARRHFELNLVRLIPDIEAAPVAIMAAEDAEAETNLTFVMLRGVAPAHVDYLRTMGVRASLSISLMVNGRLWGLITCHHHAARTLAAPQLQACELAGQMIAIFIEGQQNAERLQRLIKAQELAYAIGRRAIDDQDFVERLRPFVSHMTELFGADSIVSRIDGSWQPLHGWRGEEIDFKPLVPHLQDGAFIADRLSDFLSIDPAVQSELAGGTYLAMADSEEDYLFFGRREHPHSVTWAGQPTGGAASPEPGSGAQLPRRSFAAWQEQIRGRSRPFLEHEREALGIVLQALRASFSAYRERRLRAAQAEAEALQGQLRLQLLNTARLASMGELAAALAHELNQPLTAITNFVNAVRHRMLASDGGHDEDILELMDDAVSETQRAGELVHRLRNFVQRGDIERAPVDLAALVLDAAKLALSTSSSGAIDLKTAFPADLPPIEVDSVQIEQVVFNLVRNAIDAMGSSQTRQLSLGIDGKEGRMVEVAVEDSGPGIADDILPTLFKPFESSKLGGMGIGLSLCRSIVEAHGGRMAFANTGDGARFSFTLPATNGTGNA